MELVEIQHTLTELYESLVASEQLQMPAIARCIQSTLRLPGLATFGEADRKSLRANVPLRLPCGGSECILPIHAQECTSARLL